MSAVTRQRSLGIGSAVALIGAPASVLLVALSTTPAAATGVIVDSTADGGADASHCTDNTPGNCTLRDAAASLTGPGETITFDPTVFANPTTITLNQYQGVALQWPVTITGTGADSLTVDANGNYSVFYLREYTQSGTTTIESMTITGARHGIQSVEEAGGGELVLNDLIVSGNTGAFGAGVYATGQWTTTVTGSTFSGNSASNGGAIWSQGPLTISGCTFSGNHASNYGGAIAVGPDGFGEAAPQFAVMNSTFTENSAGERGGALYIGGSWNGTSVISDSTLTKNTSRRGSAIYVARDETVSILHTTVSGNIATANADAYYTGAIQLSGLPTFPVLTISNSIVSGNDAVTAPADLSVTQAGRFTFDASYSVLGQVSTSLTNTSPYASTVTTSDDPGLATLQDNGGPTMTMALLPGSPAIGIGRTPVPSFPGNLYDQRGRGFTRVYGTRADAGAFESRYLADAELGPKFTG